MGNSPTNQQETSFEKKGRYEDRMMLNPGCLGCFPNPSNKGNYEMVDHHELRTHNQEQVPKGKISNNSISYLSNDEIGFLKACAGKNISAIRYYLKKTVNVNLLDEDRTSPLHVACRCGSLQVVEELLNWGSMLDIADIAGWTPLHIAAHYQRPYVCHILLKKGACPYFASRNGETPWDLVKDKNTEEIFFVHFDRTELRKMSKVKTANPPGEIVDENPGLSSPVPRENAFRSMIELEYKDFVREGQILHSPKSSKLQSKFQQVDNKYAKPQNYQRPLSSIEIMGNQNNQKTEFQELGNIQNVPLPKEKKNLQGINFPKKHKYYLYFKKMKSSQVKTSLSNGNKDQSEFLCTLRSEDSYSEDDNIVNGMLNFDNASNNDITSHRREDDEASENISPIELGFGRENSKNPITPGGYSQKSLLKNALKANHSSAFSRNGSLNNSLTGFGSVRGEKMNSSVKSFLLFQPTISLLNLVQRDPKEIMFSFGDNTELEKNELQLQKLQYDFEKKLQIDENLFKIDTRFTDSLYKMGIELFNYNGIYGLSFLILFKMLRKSVREIAFFLYKEETSMTYKKNPQAISELLTNFKIKECQDLLYSFAGFYHFEGLNFFQSLKTYLQDIVIDGDPEKIDWLLRGFSKKYFHKYKNALSTTQTKGESFESLESVHMLAFATVMLSFDIHSEIEYNHIIKDERFMQERKKEFYTNIAGINEGENFGKHFLEDLYEKIKQNNILKIQNANEGFAKQQNKKISFRSAKFVIKAHKNSKKKKDQLKDFLIYFNGPIIFVVRLFDGKSMPKYILLTSESKIKIFKNSVITFTEKSSNGVEMTLAKFKGNSIQITKKPEFSFTLVNSEDFTKIQNHINSVTK